MGQFDRLTASLDTPDEETKIAAGGRGGEEKEGGLIVFHGNFEYALPLVYVVFRLLMPQGLSINIRLAFMITRTDCQCTHGGLGMGLEVVKTNTSHWLSQVLVWM